MTARNVHSNDDEEEVTMTEAMTEARVEHEAALEVEQEAEAEL